MKYAWKDGRFYTVDANDVMDELSQMGVEDQGITPEMVVERARHPQSVMHSLFEWDDAEAAEKYREDQARHLMRAIVIVPETDAPKPVIVRAIVVASEDGEGKNRYWKTESVITNDTMTWKILFDAAKDVRAMSARFRGLAYYSGKLAQMADGLDDWASWIEPRDKDTETQKDGSSPASRRIVPLKLTHPEIQQSNRSKKRKN